jgi:hypothetical protein
MQCTSSITNDTGAYFAKFKSILVNELLLIKLSAVIYKILINPIAISEKTFSKYCGG